MKLSRKEALLIATDAISKVEGCADRWRFRVPVQARDLDGATTQVTAATYLRARRARTEAVVQLALTLLGVHGTIDFEGIGDGSARHILDRVLADRDFFII